MADWEDAALSNRHMHNRVGRHGRAKHGKSGGAFDARKTFGTYEVKCPAAAKLATSDADSAQAAKLEIYTLNYGGNALLAELFLPQVLHATVLLAGSRKTMNAVVRDLEAAREGSEEDMDAGTEAGPTRSDRDEDDGDEDEEHTQPYEDPTNRVVREFEKNSFRSPKFWMRWQGQLLQSSTDSSVTDSTSGPGYLIFSGNSCDKFQGTFTCQQLGWHNVKVSGWKTASRSARDFAVAWHQEPE